MRPLSIFEPLEQKGYLTPPDGILSDEDAATISAGLADLPPRDQPLASGLLSDYRNFRLAYPRPLSPEEQENRRLNQARVAGYYGNFDQATAGMALKSLDFAEGAQKDSLKKELANSAMLRHVVGPGAELEGMNRQRLLDGVANQLFDGEGKGSEDNFHAAAKGWFDGQNAEKVVIEGGISEESRKGALLRIAQRDALAGVPWAEGFSKWQAEQGGREEWKTGVKQLAKRDLAGLYRQVYEATSAKVDPWRPQIQAVYESLKKEYGEKEGQINMGEMKRYADPGTAAAEVWNMPMDEFRAIALPALAAYAELHPADAKGFFQQMDETGVRMSSRFLRGLGTVTEMAADGQPDASGGYRLPAENLAASNKQQDAAAEFNAKRELLAKVGEGSLDPINPVAASDFWQGAENMAYDTFGSMVMMGTMLIPYAGAAGNIAAYENENMAELMMDYPRMSQKNAELIGTIAAPAQYALDRLGLEVVGGKIPGVKQLLERVAKPGASWEKFAVWGLGGAGFEYGVEITQDAVPLIAQDLVAALKNDVPNANWDDFKALDLRTALAMLPLALVGAGAATFRDSRAAREMVGDSSLMAVAGLSPEQIQRIQSPQTIEGQLQALRTEWNSRNMKAAGAAPGAESVAEVVGAGRSAQAVEAWQKQVAAAQRAQSDFRAANVRLDRSTAEDGSSQWIVTTADGKKIAHSDAQAAVATAQSAMTESGIQKDDAFFKAYAEMAQKPDAMIEVTNERRNLLQDAEDARTRTDEAANDAERAAAVQELEDIYSRANVHLRQEGKADVTRDLANDNTRAALANMQVLGKNAAEFREGMARAVSYVYEGGDARTLVEEESEGDAKRFTAQGGLPALAKGLRALEAATGDKYLHGEETDAVAVTEGWSDAALLWATQSRKTTVGGAVRKTTAAEARAARRRMAKEKAKGDEATAGIFQKLDAYFQAFKAMMGRAARLAKAKADGAIPADIQTMLDRSAGVDLEKQHVAAVREAVQAETTYSLRSADSLDAIADEVRKRARNPGERLTAMQRAADELSGRVRSLRWNDSVDESMVNEEGARMMAAQARESRAIQERHEEATQKLSAEQDIETGGAREDGWSADQRDALNVRHGRARDALKNRQRKESTELKAKQEAETKRRERLTGESAVRRDQLRYLSALDAILVQFPAEVRAKVGGWVPLARLTTNEARQAFILERVEKLDRVVEKYLRKEYRGDIEKLFTKAEPKREGGERDVGKLGAMGHAWFDAARAASQMTAEQAASRINDIEAMESRDLTPAEILNLQRMWGPEAVTDEATAREMLAEETTILEAFGGMEEMDAAALASAYKLADDAYTTNRHEWIADLAARKERREKQRETSTAEAGGAYDAATHNRMNARKNALRTVARAMEGFADMHFAPEAHVGNVFGFESKTRDWSQRQIYRATSAETDGINARNEAMADMFRAVIPGGEVGRMRKIRKLQTREDTKIPGPAANLSQMQGVHITMLETDPDSAAWLAEHGWTPEIFQKVEAWLSPEAKAIRSWLADQYDAQYDRINAVYSRMKGVNLPRVRNYAPRLVEHGGAQTEMTLDGQNIAGMSTGFTRRRFQKPTGPPKLADALSAYVANGRVVEHYLAWAEPMAEFKATVLSRDVRLAAETHKGAQKYSKLSRSLKILEEDGIKQAILQSEVGALLARWMDGNSKVALLAKTALMAKQTPAMLASSARVGAADFMQSSARVAAGQGAVSLREMWNSGIIQRRLPNDSDLARRLALGERSGGMVQVPHVTEIIAYAEGKNWDAIGAADAGFTLWSATVAYDASYRDSLKAGIAEEDARADAWERAGIIVEQTAQPTSTSAKSLMELEMGVWGRIFFAFQGPTRPLWAAWYEAAKSGNAANFIDVSLAAGVMIPAMTFVIGALLKAGLTDDDLDDVFTTEKFRTALAVAPAQGIIGFGPVADYFAQSKGASPRLAAVPAEETAKAIKAAFAKYEKGQDLTEAQTANLIRGVGIILGGKAAAAASLTNTWKELKGAWENLR